MTVHGNISKVLRFIRIYGIRRTIIKILGRVKFNVPISPFINFPKFIKNGKTIGLIGCGQHTFSSLAFFIANKSNAKIIWAYDINSLAQKKLIKTYNIPQEKHFKSLSDHVLPDIVYIASNHSTHTEYALRYLKKGCDVFIEKPIAVNVSELALLNDHQKEHKTKIYAGYNRPYSKAIKILKSKLSKYKDLPMSINYFVIGHKLPTDHWYRDEKEGTRVIGNIGHWIDLSLNLLISQKRFLGPVEINISYSNLNTPSENISIVFTTPSNDLISILKTTGIS